MLDKTFNPQDVEGRIYAQWQASGAFRAGTRPGRRAFSIVIPPPNITGRLHIGHALNNTLQDILARFERMRGKDVLWQPGTDHAGIATQLIVERQLAERQMNRDRPGPREIPGRRSGSGRPNPAAPSSSSCTGWAPAADWSRERFTMDEGLSRAVAKVFVELYRQGLIYKDKRLVNWDPRLQTAVSRPGSRKYRDQGPSLAHQISHRRQPATFITVATTRPETMLGDTAVAVHPDDERYKALVGQHGGAAADRAADPDHRRRTFRSGERHRRGQDHARP